MPSDEISSAGWNAIDSALQKIYHGQTPRHYGTLLKYELGGPDPLTGISAYKRLEPVPHWHFITFGFSELYNKTSKNKDISGWGFELTFRLKPEAGSEEPPMWVLDFLQNLARYVFSSGNAFAPGDYMNLNGPIAVGVETKICSVALVQDPELSPIETPNGRLQFLQLVGITNDEELAIKQWTATKALAVFQPHLPLYVTDLNRNSLLSNAEVEKSVAKGASADGSNTSAILIDQLAWSVERRVLRQPLIKIVMGARQIGELVSLLPFRLPYQRPFELVGQQYEIVMVPSERNGHEAADKALKLFLQRDTVKEIAAILTPKEGVYELPSFPELQLQVRKTYIKDQKGNVVETIG